MRVVRGSRILQQIWKAFPLALRTYRGSCPCKHSRKEYTTISVANTKMTTFSSNENDDGEAMCELYWIGENTLNRGPTNGRL